jgi:hypothetical protein
VLNFDGAADGFDETVPDGVVDGFDAAAAAATFVDTMGVTAVDVFFAAV